MHNGGYARLQRLSILVYDFSQNCVYPLGQIFKINLILTFQVANTY